MAKADKMVGGNKKSVAKVAWSYTTGAITLSGTAADVREAGMAAAAAEKAVEEAGELAEALDLDPVVGEPRPRGTRSST